MSNAILLEPLVPASISMAGSVTSAGFDFTGGSLPSGATLTRASVGTRYNSSGVLVSESANVARFDYDPATLAPRGLLIEPLRTNILIQSQQVDLWSQQLTTTSADAAVAPDGTTTADLVYPTSTGIAREVYKTPNVSGNYAFSTYLKSASKQWGFLGTNDPASNTGAWYDLVNYAVGNVGASYAASAMRGASSWLRANLIANGSSTFFVVAPADANGSGTATTSGTSGIDVWGGQLELIGSGERAEPSSYVPTTTVAATRAADALTLNWGSLGIPNGTYNVTYTFDDGSTQVVSTVVAGGTSTVPTNLNRAWIKSATVSIPAAGPDVGVAANLLNDYAGVIAQAGCAIGSANQATITLDLGADTSIDTIMVFGVELFPTTGALKINYATAAQGNFTGSFSTDTSGVPYAGSAAMTSGKGVSFWRTAAPVTARYVQIVYEAGVGVTGKSVRASRVVVGKAIQLQRNFSYGGGPGVRDLGGLDFSRRAVLTRVFGKKLRTQQLTFSNINKDEVEATVKPLMERIGNTAMIALLTDPAADAQRQNRSYYGPLVGDLGVIQRNARAWESKTNMLSIF